MERERKKEGQRERVRERERRQRDKQTQTHRHTQAQREREREREAERQKDRSDMQRAVAGRAYQASSSFVSDCMPKAMTAVLLKPDSLAEYCSHLFMTRLCRTGYLVWSDTVPQWIEARVVPFLVAARIASP